MRERVLFAAHPLSVCALTRLRFEDCFCRQLSISEQEKQLRSVHVEVLKHLYREV